MGDPARMQRKPVVRVLYWLAKNLGSGKELEASSESTSSSIHGMEIILETTDDTDSHRVTKSMRDTRTLILHTTCYLA